jgi:hypothetical protein
VSEELREAFQVIGGLQNEIKETKNTIHIVAAELKAAINGVTELLVAKQQYTHPNLETSSPGCKFQTVTNWIQDRSGDQTKKRNRNYKVMRACEIITFLAVVCETQEEILTCIEQNKKIILHEKLVKLSIFSMFPFFAT